MKSLTLALLVAAAPLAAHAAPVDRVVAVVNGEAILQSDLTKARAELVKENALAGRDESLNDKELLQRLIDDKLANQEAAKLSIEVTEKEVDAAVEDVLRQYGLELDGLKKRLQEQGVAYPEYRKKIEDQIRRLKLTNRTVRSRVVVDQSRMQAYYSQHRDEFKDDPKVHLKQAVFTGPDAVAQANEVYRAGSLAPEAFEAGAKARNADVVDLGQIRLDRLSPEFAKLVAPLEPGESAPPVQTNLGVQLLYMQEKLPARVKSFEEVRGEIEERLGREETERQFTKWLQELRDKSLVEIKI